MTLDGDDLDLILGVLNRFRIEMEGQCSPQAGLMRVTGAAWYACIKYTSPRLVELIGRIEQYKADVENGDA